MWWCDLPNAITFFCIWKKLKSKERKCPSTSIVCETIMWWSEIVIFFKKIKMSSMKIWLHFHISFSNHFVDSPLHHHHHHPFNFLLILETWLVPPHHTMFNNNIKTLFSFQIRVISSIQVEDNLKRCHVIFFIFKKVLLHHHWNSLCHVCLQILRLRHFLFIYNKKNIRRIINFRISNDAKDIRWKTSRLSLVLMIQLLLHTRIFH